MPTNPPRQAIVNMLDMFSSLRDHIISCCRTVRNIVYAMERLDKILNLPLQAQDGIAGRRVENAANNYRPRAPLADAADWRANRAFFVERCR